MKKIIVLLAILLNFVPADEPATAKQNLAGQPENAAENLTEPTAKDEAKRLYEAAAKLEDEGDKT